ncbi:MAG: acyltransferase [Blautia sp.]|nr:acyltransferase [Blautia sp.]
MNSHIYHETKPVYALRGIGAIIIAFFYHHYHFTTKHNSVFLDGLTGNWFRNGYLFVETFFMISGFVIALNYTGRMLKNEVSLKDFMWRRISHLYPLFFLTLVIAAGEHIAYFFIAGQKYFLYEVDFFHFILNLLLIHCGWFGQKNSFNGPAWCISIEIFCYLLFFGMIRLRKRYGFSGFLYIFPALIGAFCIYKKWSFPIFNVKMGRGVCSFFIGVIIFELWNCYYLNKSSIRITFINALILLSLSGFVAALHIWGMDWIGKLQMVFIFFLSPAMLWLCVTPGPIHYLMSFPPLVNAGRISLSIYLWNIPVQLFIILCNIIFNLNINYMSKTFFFINFVIEIMIAAISYLLIEKRSRKISKMFVDYLLHKEDS